MRKILLFVLVICLTFSMTTIAFGHPDDIPIIYSIELPVVEE